MDILVPSAILALISSFIIELLKLTIFQKFDSDKQKILAFLVAFVAVGIYFLSIQAPASIQEGLSMFLLTLTVSYGIWKTIFKSIRILAAQVKNRSKKKK